MAVITAWKCDRDDSMFENKKLADAHDKMLELAESITHLIELNIKSISDTDAEAIGLMLAKRSEGLMKACKGKPEVLLEVIADEAETSEAQPATTSNDDNVTAIAG